MVRDLFESLIVKTTMGTFQIILVCALCCFVNCSPQHSHGQQVMIPPKNENGPCPDLKLYDHNPWCLNCTFVDENGCLESNDVGQMAIRYKEYKCSNYTCYLPISTIIRFNKEMDGDKEIPVEHCPRMEKNGPNLLCQNCTGITDGRCQYLHGIYCEYREFNCPDFTDRSCVVLHNCTAPYVENIPDFYPKLVDLDGVTPLEVEIEGDCSPMTALEENPGCINCLYVQKNTCRKLTKYSDSTFIYEEFQCPQFNRKKCMLLKVAFSNYVGNQTDIALCPDTSRNEPNPDCTNCVLVAKPSCVVSKDIYTHVHCVYDEYVCPEYNDRHCIKLNECDGDHGVQTHGGHLNPVALASLAGAG